MNILDLFSGIGGFSSGFEKAGFKTVAFCEINEYATKVLNKHWPDIPVYNDVSKLTEKQLTKDGIEKIDIITGGFPCQDISATGKQKGINEGEKSGLWWEIPEYLRVDDGVSIELDEIKSRVKALGNSIIPEIAYLIAEQIKQND